MKGRKHFEMDEFCHRRQEIFGHLFCYSFCESFVGSPGLDSFASARGLGLGLGLFRRCLSCGGGSNWRSLGRCCSLGGCSRCFGFSRFGFMEKKDICEVVEQSFHHDSKLHLAGFRLLYLPSMTTAIFTGEDVGFSSFMAS